MTFFVKEKTEDPHIIFSFKMTPCFCIFLKALVLCIMYGKVIVTIMASF